MLASHPPDVPMYLDFYGLKAPPFSLSPSPRFLFLGEEHGGALAFLTYGIREKKGFILLTGEVGTGKTTLLQALFSNLGPDVLCAHLSNPILKVKDLFIILARTVFQEDDRFRSKAEFFFAFQDFLKACHRQQKTFLLVIDEAHKISFRLLEEIRLLSNMETAENNVMSICLVGQPELNHKLSRPEFLPVLQRIGMRYHLKPLDLRATRSYVETRLKEAGAAGEIFAQEAIKVIQECSRGYPRVINVLAENALLLGYARYSKKVSADVIRECHEEMQVSPAPPDKAVAEPKPVKSRIEPVRSTRRRGMRWAFAAAFVLIFALAAFLSREGVLEDVNIELKDRGVLPTAPANLAAPLPSFVKNPDEARPVQLEVPEHRPSSEPSDVSVVGRQDQPVARAVVEPKAPEPEAAPKPPPRTVKVRAGDTLKKLTMAIYGRADREILQFVKEANPGLSDTNRIFVKQVLIFPPSEEKSR